VQIRDSIKSLFPDRDCHTLVRPMHDERALNHLDSLEPSQLRPEFSEVGRSGAPAGMVCLIMCVAGWFKWELAPKKLIVKRVSVWCAGFVASVRLRMSSAVLVW
jgi:hypothetical protein